MTAERRGRFEAAQPLVRAGPGGADDAPVGSPKRALPVSTWLSPIILWIVFLLVHLALGVLALQTGGIPIGDVTTAYKPWAQLAEYDGVFVGISIPWVYPILALGPILAPLVFGDGGYLGGWLTMILLLDAGAFAVLILRRTRRATAAAWWWLGFLILLGPIAISRLDAVSVPIVIVGLLILATRPRLATVLLTVATWIKVWPAAVIAALLVAMRDRWRILGLCVLVSAVIVAVALALGSGLNVFSFVTAQSDRGLQIEAPISMPWMWAAALGRPDTFVYYDMRILAYQVTGGGINIAIALMTPVLVLAVIVVLLIGIRAVHSGAPVTHVLPTLSLALVSTVIAFDKVGSPQYIAWLAAPVILGLVQCGLAFRTPAILVGVTGALTQVIYPYWYNWLLVLNGYFLLDLTVRNLLLFVLLGWSLVSLWRSGSRMPRRRLETG